LSWLWRQWFEGPKEESGPETGKILRPAPWLRVTGSESNLQPDCSSAVRDVDGLTYQEDGWSRKRQLELAQVERLAAGIEGLCLYCDLRIRFQEGETICRSALSALPKPGARASMVERRASPLRANLLAWQARFSRHLGRVEDTRRLLEQSASALAAPGLCADAVRAPRAFVLADREQGIGLYRQSLDGYRALGDRWHVAQVLRAMGEILHHVATMPRQRSAYARA